ncbi:hypothetical protein BH11VER1_BH11VER1_01530 [soil metagenome]
MTRSFLSLVFLIASATCLSAQAVSLKPSENGLLIEIDGKFFTEYQIKGVPRPFFYPVIGAAGENIVRNFPMKDDVAGEPKDHKHHRGLWFAHGSLNGMDFWSEEKEFGKQEHVKFGTIKSEGNKGSFEAETKWVSPDGKVQMTDSRKVTITALPNGEKFLDFDITLKASEGEVVLGDTKEGTMAIRLSPSLCLKGEGAKGQAFNSGATQGKDIWGKKASWVCYYGPDPKGNPVGVAMFEHPKNFRAPTWWHARDYGLFAANPFGQHDFEALPKDQEKGKGNFNIAKGESLALRYRFYFAKGQPQPGDLAERFKTYSAE